MNGEEMSLLPHPQCSAASELNIEKGDILSSDSSDYRVTKVIGEGGFGKVVQCWNLDSFETVAIKVPKEANKECTQYELFMLETISILDPDQNNLVRFLEGFEYMGNTCLVFEKLDIDLFELLKLENFKPMCLSDIRDVAEQLLVALDALKGLALLHTDIKPDNVMVVSAKERPLRVKLVDFGLAVPARHVFPGMKLQAMGYRAPEVCLGLPFNEAVDVWGVGCVLAFLFLGRNLFPNHCLYQMMKNMVLTLGQPPDHQLSKGKYTKYVFIEEEVKDTGSRWRLMTPEEFSVANGRPAQKNDPYFDFPGSLDDLMEIYPVLDHIEWEERAALVHLLKGLLHVDAEQRLSPREALQHPFITGSFLNQSRLNQEFLDSPSQDPFSLEPLEGPSQDSFSLEPLEGPSQDSFSLEPLEGPSQDSFTLEPLDGPSQDQPTVCPPEESDSQDSSTGLSEPSGTFRDDAVEVSTVPVTEQRVHDEEETSGSSEEQCGAEDVPLGSTSTSRLRIVRKTMDWVFKTIWKTLFSCSNPEIDCL